MKESTAIFPSTNKMARICGFMKTTILVVTNLTMYLASTPIFLVATGMMMNLEWAAILTMMISPEKKIWIWGLSQQGMIWEKLLTDTDGQYVEVQSGRLFNQSSENSMLTPFKHRSFAPGQTDAWTEYWFPVKQTKGFVKANPYGAVNVKQEDGWLKIYFSPLQSLNEKLEILADGKSVYLKQIAVKPMQKLFIVKHFWKTNQQMLAM